MFESALAPLHLLKHPFYRDWMEGKLTHACLQDYAKQYYRHVDAFPRYLGAIHSLTLDAAARRIVLENLNDEEGARGRPHPELWIDFARGLGCSREQVESAPMRAAIKNVVDTFFTAARSSFHEGLGALYAYEAQVPEIAVSKIDGLRDRYGITDPATTAFFAVHREADVHHRAAIEKILNSLPAKEKAEAEAAAQRAALALWDFLSEVHGRNAIAA
jgi:pyrroloquinoline-quinone synthase